MTIITRENRGCALEATEENGKFHGYEVVLDNLMQQDKENTSSSRFHMTNRSSLTIKQSFPKMINLYHTNLISFSGKVIRFH